MSEREHTATMITNFDSTEQKIEWQRLIDASQDDDGNALPAAPSISELWLRDNRQRKCERLLNERTSIATHFAGIIRTAYMYCDKIMITDAQLFDGLFFLALGPTAVNGILGRSYKDGPSIIVSGRQSTLEDCLRAFTISTVGDVQQAALKADESIRPSDIGCAGKPEQHTLRPLVYCVFDHTVTHAEALGFDAGFYDDLDARIANMGKSHESWATLIAETYARVLHPDKETKSYYRFLAQRWQEWIDAERQGLVIYENQNSDEFTARAGGLKMDYYFHQYADQYARILRKQCPPRPAKNDLALRSEVEEFSNVLDSIATMDKRSDAFVCISRAKLPQRSPVTASNEPRSSNRSESKSLGYTRDTLRDWYQFVYQRALAEYLGAYLIAVDMPANSFENLIGKVQQSKGGSLMLAGAVTKDLGGMPFNRFSTFCYESRSALKRWRICNADTAKSEQRISTRNVAYLVQHAAEERSLSEDGKDMLWGALLAMVLAVLSALSDNVWFNGTAPWKIVLAAWAIAVVPNIIDVAKWLWGVHSTSKTVVYLN